MLRFWWDPEPSDLVPSLPSESLYNADIAYIADGVLETAWPLELDTKKNKGYN